MALEYKNHQDPHTNERASYISGKKAKVAKKMVYMAGTKADKKKIKPGERRTYSYPEGKVAQDRWDKK